VGRGGVERGGAGGEVWNANMGLTQEAHVHDLPVVGWALQLMDRLAAGMHCEGHCTFLARCHPPPILGARTSPGALLQAAAHTWALDLSTSSTGWTVSGLVNGWTAPHSAAQRNAAQMVPAGVLENSGCRSRYAAPSL